MMYPTPHNSASPADFAKTVLMPGDPLRAKYIAERYLTDAKLVNAVRGINGYTGFYQDTRVSVMASGMGMPSIGIYSYELFYIYGVDTILRVGSAGAIREDVNLRDLVFAMGACTDSNYAAQYHLPGTFAPIASYALLSQAIRQAERLQVPFHVGNMLSSDLFYNDDPADLMKWKKMGVLAVEMEAAALYLNAARAGKRALAICTVSDQILLEERLTAQERETSFDQMLKVALETCVAMEKETR